MANTALAKFLILLLFAMPAMCLGKAEQVEDVRKPYIVHMIKSMKPQHFNLHQHWYASMLSQVSQSDPTANGNEMLYTYDTLLHGFAARLSESEAEAMEGMEGCLAVIPSSLSKIATTHTPEFLGLSSSSSPGLWSQYSTYGEDVIVGVIDTGIWPESKSFNDAGLGPVPSRWNGTCESGRDFNSSHCNRKIIGARYFYKGYENHISKINESLEYKSPRDAQGHGTHTASTAAGAPVSGATLFGFANGTARGMAPRARLAIYKVCWAPFGQCDESDIAAAMEQAIADGVDILSISISSADVPFHMDLRAIAAFGATERGVFVSAAAGNDGPVSSTLSNTAPWITTVGASSIDRDFPASLVLGNQEIYRSTSTFKGGDGKLQGPFPLVYVSASNSSKRCLDGSLDPIAVKGKIVLCDQLLFSTNPDESGAPEKANEVARAGGAGMIVANEELLGAQQQFSNTYNFPSISVSFKAGERIKSYINSTTLNNATAAMRLTGLTIVGNATAAPIVAAFSSRGPSAAYPSVLKPDMVAPGVNVLAAYAGGVDYYLDSGTSMACPHVSGIAALMKAIHPTWSPAAIKSALMTSSYIVDNRKQAIRDSVSMEAANPFDMGAGHVNPRAAVDPGLVYDLAPQDYVHFLCTLNYTDKQIALLTKKLISCPNSSLEAGDLNYPSFSIVFKPGNNSAEVNRRTVTNVGAEGNVVYRVSVKSPPGVNISVEPQTLVFKNLYDKASYSVKFESNLTSPSAAEGDQNRFGEISWSCINGGTQVVRSPVAFTWQASN